MGYPAQRARQKVLDFRISKKKKENQTKVSYHKRKSIEAKIYLKMIDFDGKWFLTHLYKEKISPLMKSNVIN